MKARPDLLVTLALTLAVLACSAPGATTPDEGAVATSVAATILAARPATPTYTPHPPTPALPPRNHLLWMAYEGSGDQIWVLGEGDPYLMTLPFSLGQFYDYASATNRILYATRFADHGAGPGNVAVSDLAILDVNSGSSTLLFSDNMVEALWMPNGVDVAYILATPFTYELHLRTGDGGDRILATNVTFTWGVSPTGEAIAFTRETGYEIPIDPGLYIVLVGTGEERKLSDVDKQGTGSIDDRPFWSFDGRYVTLSAWGGPDTARLVRAAIDGSDTADITLDPSLSSESWYSNSLVTLLWHPNGNQLVGIPPISMGEMGGPSPLVLYTMDPAAHTIMAGTQFGEAMGLVAWDIPGVSIWIQASDGTIQRVALP